MAAQKRNDLIDIVKGVVIFLMLWGHCIQYCIAGSGKDFFENLVFKIIYAFHMPILMLISGYLFSASFAKRERNELIIQKTQGLLQPIVFCSFFNYMVTTALFGVIADRDFMVLFNGGWMDNLSSLWFLWSVLTASLAVAVICKTIDNVVFQILLLFAVIPIVATFPNAMKNLFMYPYFILGFYYGKYKDKVQILHKFKKLTIPAFVIMLCFYERKHYIYTTGLLPSEEYSLEEMLKIDAFRWMIGLIGSICVLTVIEYAYHRTTPRFRETVLFKSLTWMGKNSLKIYAFSVAILSGYLSVLFPKMLKLFGIENVFAKNELIYSLFFTFWMAALYAFILFAIIKVFDKHKISTLFFGR